MPSIAKILVISLAPVSFFFTVIYLRDRFEREPLRLLIFSFILGAISTIPAGVFQFSTGVASNDISTYSLPALFFTTMFLIAGSEELSKFLMFRWFIYRRPEFDEPYDGIMYAVAISLGFAALENFVYVLGFGLQIGLLRAVTAIPAHCAFGVFLGYYAGRAKFIVPERASRELSRGLLAAVFAHGLYDFCAFSSDPNVSYCSLIVLALCIRYSLKALKIQAMCELPSNLT
jgi:RsiW-degrading membrane proteinase PrsW (M82 family)